MKYQLISFIRAIGLLKAADHVKFWYNCLRNWPRNRAFKRENPGFGIPPAELSFDALNHADWTTYKESGEELARTFTRIIKRELPQKQLDILEWGCGPGRILRHMPVDLGDVKTRLTGSDYNPRSIAWCRENLSGIEFIQNELLPPLPFSASRFDVVYCFSVFTHLSEDVQHAWAAEIGRVLKPNGLFISTTHGDRHRYLLTGKQDIERYEAGKVVIQGNYVEGRKWFFAIHPPQYVETVLLKDFSSVKQEIGLSENQLIQDVWLARKPSGE